MALFMLAVGVLAWNGWDLAQDSQTKRLKLKRHGKVVWTSGGKATTGSFWEAG